MRDWRQSRCLSIAPCKGIRIPESVKFLLVESGILGFGIRNTALRIRKPIKDLMEFSLWNPESKAWKPESTTVLDSLT